MKSNMNSLTKKLLFFLTFSILSDFATSDCVSIVSDFFFYYNVPLESFKIGMTALSSPLINSFFDTAFIELLYQTYITVRVPVFTAERQTIIEYFNHLSTWKKPHGISKDLIRRELNGYFTSFAVAILQNENSDNINNSGIAQSPQAFCNERRHRFPNCEPELSAMLAVTADENFAEITAAQALSHCYLNYVFTDFVNDYHGVTAAYFNHMISASKQFHTFNKPGNPSGNPTIFLTVEQYCSNRPAVMPELKITGKTLLGTESTSAGTTMYKSEKKTTRKHRKRQN